VRVFNAIGRLITNPPCAALICAFGACVLWFYITPQRAGGSTADLSGMPGTGHRSVTATRSDALGRGSPAPTKAGDAHKKQAARARITASARAGAEQGQAQDRHDLLVEHFEAENEPQESPTTPAATKRPEPRSQATGKETVKTSTADVISPLDPRANALAEYQTKNAGIADTISPQKQLALWCDQEGLWDTAKAHWETVLRLDPENEAARKRLGFRLRDRAWIFDAASGDEVAQKRANVYWSKTLEKLHAQMKCKSKVAAPGRAEAVAHIEAVGDPRAAAEIWNAFAADVSHHGLMAGTLSRFKTAEASRMLAAIAVYSRDEKAQAASVAALHLREATEYGEKLVTLMRAPMRIEERQVPNPGGIPARMLFVEGDTQNYLFLFSRAEAPTSDTLQGCFQPRLSASEIEMARRYNENQATMAQQAMNEQVAWAKAMIQKYNDSIQALNQRVAKVLNEACGAGVTPQPEDGRRWLASALGTQYEPAVDRPKPTITEIVAPLYSPTFLPIPVAT
jgi:hypothetical protein